MCGPNTVRNSTLSGIFFSYDQRYAGVFLWKSWNNYLWSLAHWSYVLMFLPSNAFHCMENFFIWFYFSTKKLPSWILFVEKVYLQGMFLGKYRMCLLDWPVIWFKDFQFQESELTLVIIQIEGSLYWFCRLQNWIQGHKGPLGECDLFIPTTEKHRQAWDT